MEEHTAEFILIMLFMTALALLFARGLNRVLENQDRMLCESALISENREYLTKCECYYQGGDIKCLQK